jgi:phosphate butyryltransferase
MIHNFSELLAAAVAGSGSVARVAVVGADSATGLAAVLQAAREGFAQPVLIGDERLIREVAAARGLDVSGASWAPADAPDAAAACAAALAGAGEVDVLLKGSLRTDQLLRAVLDRRHGLRTDGLLSDVLLYEDTLAGDVRLVAVTDGGINPAPDAAALGRIVANAVKVMRALGFERPKVALLSATEAVTESVASTVVARQIQEEAAGGAFGECEVQGPLALDNALLASAAEAKGIAGPVAGRADILVLPNIEAGNVLGKAVKYFGGSITAHVVVGARVPVLIPSRVESEADKLHSIALGVLLGREAE